MKSLAFLEHVDHSRKAAIYAAEHDGKLRHFAYYEELGECRETFAQLLQDVQKGEIGVILTPDAILKQLSKRSEEHTSELQSHSDLVCRLLLEKKKREISHSCMGCNAAI